MAKPGLSSAADGRRAVGTDNPVDVRSVVLTGIFVLLLFYTFFFAAPIIMPVTVALLLYFLLAPAVRAMARLCIPQTISALVALALTIAMLAGAAILLAEPAQEWMKKAPVSFYKVEQRLRSLRGPIEQIQQATEQLEQAANVGGENTTQKVAIEQPGVARVLLSGTSEILASIGIVVVLLFFLLASGDALRRKIISVIPRLRDKKRALEIMHGVERDISYYLLTVTFINLGLGLFTTLILHLLEVPNPLLWGVMVAILNFAPYLGAAASTLILTAVGLLSFDSLAQAFLVPGTFVGLTILEGQFVTPMVLGRRLALSPVAIFIAMILWGWLWGVTGALIAVPLLVSFKIVCEKLEPLNPVAEFLAP